MLAKQVQMWCLVRSCNACVFFLSCLYVHLAHSLTHSLTPSTTIIGTLARQRAVEQQCLLREESSRRIASTWRLYRWKRFGWNLCKYLYVHRQAEADRDEKEEVAFRLRIARKSVQENAFFHGISGDDVLGPKAAVRNGKSLPSGVLNNPNFSLHLKHKLALQQQSEVRACPVCHVWKLLFYFLPFAH